MLSFDASLLSALKNANPVSFWTLKLYYNDDSSASNFIGVSDQDRVDGADTYRGLISSWGNLQQSIDFFNFSSSTANTSVKLINTEFSIAGGKFSDLFATKNFANRKWELFQNTNGLSTFDTAARMIGTGIISGNIEYDNSFITFTLVDYSSRYHKQIPKNTVVAATYTSAPENNINKPIPISYGDFHDKTDAGTIPTSGANFDRHFTKAKFPAIIVNKWDETNYRTEALVDSVPVHTLDTKNVYMAAGGEYGACLDSNVTESESNYKITALGTDWRFYTPLIKHSTYSGGTNYGNMMDNSFSGTGYSLAQTGAGATSVGFRIGRMPNMGVLTTAYLLIDFGTFSGSAPNVAFKASPGAGAGGATTSTIAWTSGDKEVAVTGFFSTGDATAWDVEREFFLTIDNTGGSGNMNVYINEIGIEFRVSPSMTFTHRMGEIIEVPSSRYISPYYSKSEVAGTNVDSVKKVVNTKTLISPASIDYLYYSGKGRMYGAWIDDIDGGTDNRTSHNGDEPDPNYTEDDLIENPVYMIEDILRRELSLDSSTDGSDIDIETFDKAGNAQTNDTRGDISYTYNDAIADIKFAFSQYKFINSKDMINKICRQICSWVWISGSGKFKIRTLLRPGDTWAEDKTIDFHDISLKSISRTNIDDVRNDINVHYNRDYVQDQTMSTASPTDDSTSVGNTVDGYKQTLSLDIEADIIDDDTVGVTADKGLADAYLKILKDRRIILKFDCQRPIHNDLEITDIIKFENWDSKIKLYGVAMGTDYFMITNISKTPFNCSITAIQVKTLANA